MLKFGIITDVDLKRGLARVNFSEDDMVSSWIKMSVMRSGKDQLSFPFDINEHVWCLMDDHCEYGVIGGAVYDQNNLPKNSSAGKLRINFGDDSVVEYDRVSHILNLDIKGQVTIKCTDCEIESTGSAEIKAVEAKITAPVTTMSGAVTIEGILSVGGLSGISGGAISAGDSEMKVKNLTATDDVKAGTISLKSHKHTSTGNGSPTSAPI